STTVRAEVSFDTPGGVTIPTLVLKGGELTGSADITVTRRFDWQAGQMSGTGATTVAQGALLTLSGQVELDRTLSNAGNASSSNSEVRGSGLFDNQGTITSAEAAWSPNFTNEGTFIKASGGVAVFRAGFSNTGTIEVQVGTFEVDGAFPSLSGSTLQTGTYILNGVLQLSQGSIVTNAAAIVLDQPGGAIVDGSGADMLANLASNAAGASFTVQNGRNFTTAGALANAGSITVGPGSTLTVNGNYTQAATGVLSAQIGED